MRESPESRPISRGAKRNFSIDFTADIAAGSLLTTPLTIVQAAGSGTLTITNKAVNTATYVDKHTGATIAIGKAVQCTVQVPPGAKRGVYAIDITVTTNDSAAETLPYRINFRVS